MKKISLFLATVFLLSSCASILNPKYQKVYVSTPDRDAVVTINSDTAKKKEGKYLFRRNGHPKQITLKKDGFKDQTTSIAQYKKSPLYILSVVPFGILFYPIFMDAGPKAFDYPSRVRIPEMIKKPTRDEADKEIILTNVEVNLPKDSVKIIRVNYSKIANGKELSGNKRNSVNLDKNINIENTVYPVLLNKILKETGYIDTTNRALKNSYLNNLKIKANIYNNDIYIIYNLRTSSLYAVDLKVKWQALDYYDQPIYTFYSDTRSGMFCEADDNTSSIEFAVRDALELGFYDFMKSDSLQILLKDKSAASEENEMEEFDIPIAKNYAENLGDAIKASVTIKNKDGHGSGFFISENGYIITNYHVAVEKDIKVVTHDDKEYDLEVVRVSKINDLALLKIDAKIEKPLKISNNHDITIAQEAYAVGTPSAEDLTQSISKGIISGVRKRDGGGKIIQTDASINGGNSGGAFVLKNGIVIGVVTSKLVGRSVEGVGFVIPSYEIIDKLKLKYTEK